jgi:dTMP kinase
MTRGRYIAFEGLEGCGKSTHVTRLAATLNGITTREPGGTAIGASLRTAMLDTSNTMLSPRAEALMMAADRAQHLDELVPPAPTLSATAALIHHLPIRAMAACSTSTN